MSSNQKLADLTPDPNNANLGTERGMNLLETSLAQFGAGRSILVDKHGKIIAGNKTAETAGSLGMDDVIVVETDGTKVVAVQRTDLDLDNDIKARELAYADNRISELDLNWDLEKLQKDLAEGIDLEGHGLWVESELKNLFEIEASPPEEFKDYDEDIDTDHKCPKCGYQWSGVVK